MHGCGWSEYIEKQCALCHGLKGHRVGEDLHIFVLWLKEYDFLSVNLIGSSFSFKKWEKLPSALGKIERIFSTIF